MEILILYYTVLFYFSLVLGVIIHETGHLIAVVSVGHKLTQFSAGPISIKLTEAGYKIRPRYSIFTGFVQYERVLEKTTWGNEVLIVSGGIIANLIVGIGLIIYYYLSSSSAFSAMVGGISLLIGVTNLFPSHIKGLGVDSDAKRFLDMFRFKKAAAQSKSYGLVVPGVLPQVASYSEGAVGKTQIELLNDDFTPMDFVIDILRTVFKLDNFSSVLMMLSIHNTGNAKFGWLDADEARSIIEHVNSEAKRHGFPFKCRIFVE